MRTITIRDLSIEDAFNPEFYEALSELSGCKLDESLVKQIFYDRQHAGVRTIVVCVHDTIIGTGSIFIETKFLHNGGKVGHIEDVAIASDYKKMGMGKIIMNYLIDIARQDGCYKVILNCSPDVVEFYEKFGFKKHEYEMRLDL